MVYETRQVIFTLKIRPIYIFLKKSTFQASPIPPGQFLDILQVINIHETDTQLYKQDVLPKLAFYNLVLFQKT